MITNTHRIGTSVGSTGVVELSRLRRRVWLEVSFPSLSLPLQGYRLLTGHRGKVKGMDVVFRGFLCGNVLCPDHSCFYSCLDLIVLGSTLRIYFCPGQERGAPSLAVLFQEGPAETSRHVQKVKGFVLVFVFWIDVFIFL